MADFDVKAPLSNKIEQKLNLHMALSQGTGSLQLQIGNEALTTYRLHYLFSTEVIPYQEQLNRPTVKKVEL